MNEHSQKETGTFPVTLEIKTYEHTGPVGNKFMRGTGTGYSATLWATFPAPEHAEAPNNSPHPALVEVITKYSAFSEWSAFFDVVETMRDAFKALKEEGR